MPNDFGMPFLLETPTIADAAALCAELGLSFVELNTNFPNQQLHLLDAKHLRALAEKHGIGYTQVSFRVFKVNRIYLVRHGA